MSSIDIASGSVDLYLYDTTSGTNTKLNPESADLVTAQLSYDGTKLLFSGYDSAGYVQIYIADAKFQTLVQLTTAEVDHYDVLLSKDGSTVAYDSDSGSIYTMPATLTPTGAVPTPTLIDTSAINYAWGPAFTPDGTKVVFSGRASGINQAVFIIGVDGSGLKALSLPATTYYDEFPTVSNDGTMVAFERESGSGVNIASMSISGETSTGSATILTTDNYSWQPLYLGSKILYMSKKDNISGTDADNIYIMNADGSSVTRLTNTTLEDGFNLLYSLD
jgi:Tol biopolymer transport system component